MDSISFEKNKNKVDWNTLVVTWKWGGVTTGEISYETPSDIPCTSLKEKNGVVIINGEPVTRKRNAAACIKRIAEFIRDTEIQDGGDIPIVISPSCVSANKGD